MKRYPRQIVWGRSGRQQQKGQQSQGVVLRGRCGLHGCWPPTERSWSVWGPTRSDRRRRHTRTQRVPVVGGVGALVTRWVTRWVPGVDVGHPVAAVAAVAAVAKVQGRQGAVAVVVTAAVAVVVVVVGCCSCQCRHHPSLGCLGQHQRRHGGGGHKLGEEARIQPVKGGNIAGSSQVHRRLLIHQ